MRKIIAIVGCVLMLLAMTGCDRFATNPMPTQSSGNDDLTGDITLTVYNWGQNIAAGEDGAIDVIALFEERYPNIKVNYLTYDSNETMYTKLKTGGISVDVIVPSDYMIGRLIAENMLLELNFDNIPNYSAVDEAYKNTAYDPENKYSVPYTWGTVGIIYNTKHVDPADVTGWELLWNEKYDDKILMFGNSRDAFGIANLLLGNDINASSEEDLQAAAQLLRQQRPLVQQYIMDEVYDLMDNEEAWIAPYYAGDYMLMAKENPDLAFYRPEHQGFNFFIDALCIPSCCQNKAAAELFINFLCEAEIAGGNMNWIGYGTPISAAKVYLEPYMSESEVAYPSEDTLANGSSFIYLDPAVNQRMEELWLEVKTD